MQYAKKFTALLLALLLCFCAVLTGCDSSPFQQGDVYTLKTLVYEEDGETHTVALKDTYQGQKIYENTFQIEFNNDKSLHVYVYNFGENQRSYDATYTYQPGENKNEYLVGVGLNTLRPQVKFTMTYTLGVLTVNYEGVQLVLTKSLPLSNNRK